MSIHLATLRTGASCTSSHHPKLQGRKWKESSHVNLCTALPHGASITVAAYLRAEASHPWCSPCDSSRCALGFFFRKLTSKKTGAGEFKTHNHQTCLLGSSGMVAHLVDLASLFLPHNTRTFTRCTSKIKSELGGISFLGGICQNPMWPGPRSAKTR